jgi:hypothetical protein
VAAKSGQEDLMAVPAAEARDRRLASVLSRARRGTRMSPEGWMITAGSALAVAGIALVIVGWVGTSRTVLVAGQIPYVVSGGLLGLGLIFLGGFLYFAYWVAMLVRQTGEQADRSREDIVRIEASLAEAADSLAVIAKLIEEGSPPAASRRPRKAGTNRTGGPITVAIRGERLVATPSGSMAHRPGCPIVSARNDLRDVAPGAPGMRPCGICHPPI